MFKNEESTTSEPLFKDLDNSSLRVTETVSEESAERFVFETVDFSDPKRPQTCIEVDFPILRVNEISAIENNATKPVYMMSKWWARRRASVFRQLFISAATKAPSRPEEAAQASWSLMYRKSHQKHGKFSKLKVLDIFMGGGTTIVEAARFGCEVIGVDINPIAWWIVKNETTPVDPKVLTDFSKYVEQTVKPQIIPYFTARSPRGFKGSWIDVATGKVTSQSPIELPFSERKRFRWEGPEVIYTFWMKHIMCSDPACFHLTPQINSSVIAEKTVKLKAWQNCVCEKCGEVFDLEQGDFRMAPDAKFVIPEEVAPFSSPDPISGKATCPHCKFELEASWVKEQENRKGKPVSKEVTHYLLLPKKWLKGITGKSKTDFGGYYGSSNIQDKAWFKARGHGLSLIEVRGTIPSELEHSNFAQKSRSEDSDESQSTGNLVCGFCNRVQDPLDSIKTSGHLAPVFPYVIQGIDPEAKRRKFSYAGRFFDLPDFELMLKAFEEFKSRSDLDEFVPKSAIPEGCETRQRKNLPAHQYLNWYQMFNPRQLYVHSLLLKTICDAPVDVASNDVKSHLYGAVQNYLRQNCMFTFWNQRYDKHAAFLSNTNFHPKATAVETGVFNDLGAGSFVSCVSNVADGLSFLELPYDLRVNHDETSAKSSKVTSADKIDPKKIKLICGSSTDLRKDVESESVDLVITDPPFGDNVNYAEMADFFLAWLHKPLSRIFPTVFNSDESPKTLEAVSNSVRNPGVNEVGQRKADLVYHRLLTLCWKEAARVLKPSGILAFTFHHDRDHAWIDVLESLFQAGFLIESTFPVRSDATRGDGKGAFGSKKIEYDIVHVCRKRDGQPSDIYWATLRKGILESVKSNAVILAQHKISGLHLADLEVIIRGEVLEQYSKHHGKVKKNLAGDAMSIREILLEANSIALSLLQSQQEDRMPENVDPETRILLNLMREGTSIERNAASKRLKGSGVTLEELIDLGWVQVSKHGTEKIVNLENPINRWNSLSRKNQLKSDWDQVHFAINCCVGGKTFKDQPADWEAWLVENYKTLLPSVGPILKFIETNHFGSDFKQAIGIAYRTLERTLQRLKETDGAFRAATEQMSLFGAEEK